MKSFKNQNNFRPSLIIICGPTAVGKSALALEVAKHFNVEVVSADSRQVYCGMDIGTAKPTPEERQRVKHHLIDIVQPDEAFNVSRYLELASTAIDDILTRHVQPIVVGGTGLYIKALTEGLISAPGGDSKIRLRLHKQAELEGRDALHQRLKVVDPVTAARLHPNDLVRTVRALEVYELTGRRLSDYHHDHAFREKPYRTMKIGLDLDRELLYEKIDKRAVKMFDDGLMEEVESLLGKGFSPQLKTMKTIGYSQALAVLRGFMSLPEAIEDLQKATRRYAKQQLTWFRHEKSIIWVDSFADFATIRALIDNFYVSS